MLFRSAGLRPWGLNKGAPGISACEPGRSRGGDRGAAVAALRGGGGDGADWWARLAATGRGQRAAESGRWLVGSGRQAVRGDLGAGRAGLRGMGRAERGQAGDEAGRAERNRPGWSGPGEPSAGRALGPSELGRWELGRAERVFWVFWVLGFLSNFYFSPF